MDVKIGRGRERNVVRPYALGEKNDRGEKWIDWCQQHEMMIMNTKIRHNLMISMHMEVPRQPHSEPNYTTANTRFINTVTNKTGRRAYWSSDHNPVFQRIRMKVKKREREREILEVYGKRKLEILPTF